MDIKTLMTCLCSIIFCGCIGSLTPESKDEEDSLTNASDLIDTKKVVRSTADTINIDSIDKNSERSPKNKWYHLTKTMYEVEFRSDKLKQDIIESIDSIDNRYTDFQKERYISLNIYDNITTTYGLQEWDGIFCGTYSTPTQPCDNILGYYIIGSHIAIVTTTPFAVSTTKNPKTMHFKWYDTTTFTSDENDPDATLVLINMFDDNYFILPINPENYFGRNDSLPSEE